MILYYQRFRRDLAALCETTPKAGGCLGVQGTVNIPYIDIHRKFQFNIKHIRLEMLYCLDFQLLAPSGLGWIQDLAPTVAWTEKGGSHVGWKGHGGQPGAKVVHIHIDRVGTFLETDEYYRCRGFSVDLGNIFLESCRFVSSLIQGPDLLLLPKESFSEGS